MFKRRQKEDSPSAETAGRPPVAFWKKVLLVISVLAMLGGGGLSVASMIRGEDAGDGGGEVSVDTGATGALQAPGFAPGGAPPGGTAAATEDTGPGGLDAWSPTIFKLGFSFFIGFCIGFAVRTFLKISVVAIGIIALAAFGLQYAGIIDVNWDAVSGHYDSVLDWLKDQTSSFTGFVQGHLPSAGLAAFGLVAGFRKR